MKIRTTPGCCPYFQTSQPPHADVAGYLTDINTVTVLIGNSGPSGAAVAYLANLPPLTKPAHTQKDTNSSLQNGSVSMFSMKITLTSDY